MTKSPSTEVVLNLMMGVLRRKAEEDLTQRHRACRPLEDRGRDWNDAATAKDRVEHPKTQAWQRFS